MAKLHKDIDASDKRPERIVLLAVDFTDFGGNRVVRQNDFQAAVAEAKELIKATGGELVETLTCQKDKPNAALFVGSGKAEEVADLVTQFEANLVVVNHPLSPTQERNLEKACQCRVIDRVGLILDIFAQRARTQEGKLQVELAQLTHLSSRLVRGYGHLQSQKGGIGMKGPGETQLETDRRLIGSKITRLKQQLQQVKQQRQTQRKSRYRNGTPTFALVGYTNAGKSSLFNRLTKAEVLAKDQLFATLDTTARRLFLAPPNVNVVLTDTVGFVRDLPHSLVEAFAATLEETAQADVLLHVVDRSHPEWSRQIDDVNEVLKQIKADDIPTLLVLNKIDLLPQNNVLPEGAVVDAKGEVVAMHVSVQSGAGLSDLRAWMTEKAQA
ncbi:GTPase HflX [Vitreoscilla stercoraria]|uniref:GTPase HflX n=1 Tax=Vitreoscilla stercoraria TaxID=61 RepID=A0ABY4EEW3_VITST|nr:GTPase HflX [Vitreoscilla stercoraria]UOO91962.1 GTPase HflX [Vitreoscilla stercoraria]